LTISEDCLKEEINEVTNLDFLLENEALVCQLITNYSESYQVSLKDAKIIKSLEEKKANSKNTQIYVSLGSILIISKAW
jgi:hypothetical protein